MQSFVSGCARHFLTLLVCCAYPALALSSPPPPPVAAPVHRKPAVSLPAIRDGRVLREFNQRGLTVSVDVTDQRLHIETPKDDDTRGRGEFRTGDLIRVRRATALRRKTTVIAPVQAGQQLTVHAVDPTGKWVEAGTLQAGQIGKGWLPIADVEFVRAEARLFPTLQHIQSEFASAGILAQKAKQFDDGLMAAVQLAAQTGHGKFVGKRDLLTRLVPRLAGANDKSIDVVLAACILGGLPTPPLADRKPAIDELLARFRGAPALSKPIAFYTWNKDLAALFQQDRMLQSDLTEGANPLPVARALHGDADARRAYENYIQLQSRLTNPQVYADLRSLLAALDTGEETPAAKGTRFFPPSFSPEIELIKRLFPSGIVPQEFPLMDELVKRVTRGEIDLAPKPDSGWYDRQLWSIEPYLLRGNTPDASRWSAGKEYRKHLLELFKGAWALARETHIKDVEVYPAPASEAPGGEPEPKIEIYVTPQLSAEPLVASYLRRASTYRYLRTVLTEAFGEESLKSLHRLTAGGAGEMTLDDELRQMEGLFFGAAVVVSRQLGLEAVSEPSVGSGQGAEADAQAFLEWTANISGDADVGTDTRMMVPLYFDPRTNQTKVWAFLGWTRKNAYVSFQSRPPVKVMDKDGKPIDAARLEVTHGSTSYRIVTPVFQELSVSTLLDRDEFRRHCDAFGSASAIVNNLK